MILSHPLPPGRINCQPQLADLLPHSILVVNIRHTPVPAVSALHSQPAIQPPFEYHLMLLLPPNCQGAIISSRHSVFSSVSRHKFVIVQSPDTWKWIRHKDSVCLFLFYCSVCVHKVLVCTCQCLCVSSDAWGCCWDFTAQHAAYHHLQFKWACMRHPVRLKQPSSPLCLIGGNHSSHLQVNPTISYWLLYWKKWAVKLLCMKQYHRGKIF